MDHYDDFGEEDPRRKMAGSSYLGRGRGTSRVFPKCKADRVRHP